MNKRIVYFLMLLLLAGCSKEPVNDGSNGKVWLKLIPEVGIETLEETTRAVVDNTEFFPLLRYGIWIEADGNDLSTNAVNTEWYYRLGYDNILANRTVFSGYGSAWSFTLNGETASFSRFGLFFGKGEQVKVYAIYPYRSDFDPATAASIPFTVGTTDETNHDYMYTGPVVVTLPSNSPTGATEISETLGFKHLMTLLEFQISTTLVGSLQINKITLEAVDAQDKPVNIFCMNGTYSAIDGVISANEFANTLAITYNKKVAYSKMPSTNQQKNPQWSSFGFIFPAVSTEIASGTKLKVKFEFDYKNLNEEDDGILKDGGEIELDLGGIETGGMPQGLMANYRYIYTISIDNFIKYHGYPEVRPWYFEKEDQGTEDKIYDIIL